MQFRWILQSHREDIIPVEFTATSWQEFFLAALDSKPAQEWGDSSLHVLIPSRASKESPIAERWCYCGWASNCCPPEIFDLECHRLWNKAVRLWRGYSCLAEAEQYQLASV